MWNMKGLWVDVLLCCVRNVRRGFGLNGPMTRGLEGLY